MQLRAVLEATGDPVAVGDEVTNFRGDKGILVSLDRARSTGRSGMVCVDRNGTKFWNYDQVWGLAVLPEGEDADPLHS